MKKFISMVLAVLLMLSVLPTGVFSITASAATSSGKTGDCTWSLNGTVLTISGSGRMADYTYSSKAPWSNNGITKVVIQNGVTNIGNYAFYYHTSLTTISIPNSVTSIGDTAFMTCTSLTNIEFPDSLTYIGDHAFCNDNLTRVTLPDSVTYIGESAFAYNNMSSIVIPKNVTVIADSTFATCSSLTSVTMHDGIVSIGDDAFSFNNLSKIIIPDSVTYIGDGAFMWNESLSTVTLGANVMTISSNAFRGCSSLTRVYYRGSQTEKSNISIYSYNTDLTSASWYYNSCINTQYHTYTDDCDTECNVCVFIREGHNYTNNCDKDCNICGFVRVPRDHIYDNACDSVCNECEEVRKITHTYSNDSDETCDICGIIRGSYTITYHLDGGTNAAKNPDVYTEEDTIILKDATKVGYDFAGWFLDANKTEQITMISAKGNVNVYAKFTPKEYAATFKDGVILTLKIEGYDDKNIYVPYGTTIDPYSKEFMCQYISSLFSSFWTETSSLDPYFSGWYIVNSYGGKTKLGSSLTMTSNTTLYCDFNLKNEDDIPSWASSYGGVQSMFNGNTTNIITCNNGYKYVRVPTLSTGSFYVQCFITLGYSSSHESISVWNLTKNEEVKKLSVSYGEYGKTYSGTKVLYHADPGDIISIHCYFGEVVFEQPTRTSSSLTSKQETKKAVYYDQDIAVPTPTNKNGYDFLGWYDSNGNKITSTWEYTENQTFTPMWQPTRYYLSYSLNGGTNSPANPSSYTIEDTITLKEPTKSGYTFKGWYSDANFTTKVTSISKKTGNIPLYAKWEVNSYNLTLDANTGVFAPKVTFVSDGLEIKSCYLYSQDTITSYRPIGKDGYIFAGWYTNDTFTSLFKFNGTITNDITLYAKWVECNSNIVNIESVGKINTTIQGKAERLYAFVPLVDGAITVTSESNNLDLYGILYDASKNVLISADDISNTDLDFTFTYSVKAGQLYYISMKGNTASTAGQAIINVLWTGACTITGTTYQNRQLTITYDTNYKLPQKPYREGYVFLGWFDENDTQITDGPWNFVTDKTLTAKWEKATYHTVIFKDLAGNIISSETYYLSEDIVAPELPTKAPDNTYIYHAKWNNGFSGVCTGDAVYSPIFDAEYIEYTIVFVNEDDTELSRGTYHYGDIITAPANPTKDADNTYTYIFIGWDKELSCTGNMTITAEYTSTYIDYTVIFKNWDGSVVSTKTYHYGDVVTVPSAPTKAADNTYTYTFKGWDKTVVSCAGNAIYTATYTSTYIDYTIVFKNWNGTILSTNTYHYGDKVTTPTNPTKISDDAYTYTFAGWDKDVVDCVGDAIYTAMYKSNYIDYTIVFKNWDGTVLSTNNYHYGDKVTAPTNPTKKADNIFTYTFAGWNKDIVDCVGDTIYTATYISTYIDYTVIFQNWNDSVISRETYHYGDTISAPNNPSKPSDNTYRYIFNGWDKELVCNGDMIITATYTPSYIDYTVTFKNWDGSVISSKTYHYGDNVVAPLTPAKTSDNTYTYTFKEWDKSVVNCNGDATYIATYTSNYIDYTVVFKNYNGAILSTNNYHYGDVVTAPSAPTKAADNTYTYTFKGWDKTVVNCAGNTTYTATYTPVYINYTVVFKDWEGTVLSTNTYHYGDVVTAPSAPTKAADNTYTYTFTGWDNPVVNCVGNAVYTAVFSPIYIDYTIIFKNWDGSILSTDTYHWGDKVIAPENPVKEPDSVGVYNFAGWDKDVVNCAGNTTYTATYELIYTPGDIDGVEGVTDRDAVHLLYHTFLPDLYPVNQDCDFNNDGFVNDKDAVYLLYHTFLPDLYPIN